MTNYFRDVAFIVGAALTFTAIIIAPAVPIAVLLIILVWLVENFAGF